MLVESEGEFSWEEWERVEYLARRECMGLGLGLVKVKKEHGDDGDMDVDEEEEEEEEGEGGARRWGKGMMARLVRDVVGRKVGRDLRWRK